PSGTVLPRTWVTQAVDFENVDLALTRTLPAMGKEPLAEEVIRGFLAEIETAENFIYIENQFLASTEIARAINARLREKPDLRVVLVSCLNPQGFMERRAMWGGRLRFRDALERGGVADRVVMAYPVCIEN